MAKHLATAHFDDDEITLVPQRWLTYNADMRGMVERREIVGPNRLGEHLVAVDCTFDDATGKSRVGFAYLPKMRPADGS